MGLVGDVSLSSKLFPAEQQYDQGETGQRIGEPIARGRPEPVRSTERARWQITYVHHLEVRREVIEDVIENGKRRPGGLISQETDLRAEMPHYPEEKGESDRGN